jgi:hypothetical protein
MASIISASTTSSTALNLSGDTTGILQLATGATPTTAVTIDASQNVGIGTIPNGGFLTGNKFEVNAGALGTTAGNISAATLLNANDGNTTVFQTYNYRVSNGSNHTTAEWRTQRVVDVSRMGYVGYGSDYLALGTTNTERMRIDSSGNVGIGTTSPASKLEVAGTGTTTINITSNTSGNSRLGLNTVGAAYNYIEADRTTGNTTFTGGNVVQVSVAGLGYGTGSGGTVTQATNKFTTVTLNKPTGKITMNNASLASNAQCLFTLNNSLLTANDNLLLTIDGTSMTIAHGVYASWCDVGAGYAFITVKNTYAIAIAEAVAINFAIIKGATS